MATHRFRNVLWSFEDSARSFIFKLVVLKRVYVLTFEKSRKIALIQGNVVLWGVLISFRKKIN